MAVRREAVRLDVEGNFVREIIADAAAVDVLTASLKGLDGTSIKADRSTKMFQRDVDALGVSSRRTSKAIDSMSGRLGIWLRVGAMLGPALAPIGAVGTVAVAGLANQLGFAAIAAGTAVLAFQGVGTALEAVNKAALEPTAENLQAARKAMQELSPAARDLVTQLQGMRPMMEQFSDTAAGGMFPGLVAGLQDIERISPQLNSVIDAVSSSLGDLFAAAGDDLAGGRWDDFFRLLETEAKPTLSALGSAVGDVVHGMSELWEAFAPLNRDFSSWMADAASGFSDWAEGLKETEGFQAFVEYIRDNGPRVADAAAAISDALVEIVTAAAPLGGPTLDVITAIAKAIGAIADSPLGTPILGFASAMSALSLAVRPLDAGLGLLEGRFGRVGASAASAKAGLSNWRPMAGGILAVGFAIGAVGEAIDALEGNDLNPQDLTRNLEAIGNGVDNAALDQAVQSARTLEMESSNLQMTMEDVRDTFLTVGSLGMGGDTGFDKAQQDIEALDQELARMVESGNVDEAVSLWQRLQDAVAADGGDVSALTGNLDAFGTALENHNDAAREGADATDDLTEAQQRLGLKANLAAARMREQRSAIRDAARGFVDLSNTLKPGKFSLDDWLTDFEKGIQAMRDFRINAQKAGENGVNQGLIRYLQKLGPEGAVQLDRLADANQGFVDRANADWRRFRRETQAAGGDLDELGRKRVNPRIEVLSNAAMMAAATATVLDRIADEQVLIKVSRVVTGLGNGIMDGINPFGSADGSTVPGPRYPYRDKVLTYLAPGEEVISNRHGQADRWRPWLKRINANAMADGGTAGGDRLPTLRELRGATDLEVRRAMREWTRAIDDSRDALSREREERDAVVSRMRDVSNSIQDGIRADLFSGEVNPWSSDFAAGSIGGVKRDLREDIAEASAMSKAIKTLRNKGLTGPALAELLAQGGLDSAVAFSKLPASELKQFAKLYGQRNRALRQVGQLGGNAAFGDALAQQNAELRAARENTKRLEGRLKDIERAIRDEGKRNDGNHRKDRDNRRRGAGNGDRNRRRDR